MSVSLCESSARFSFPLATEVLLANGSYTLDAQIRILIG
jgi:hypothetical protein